MAALRHDSSNVARMISADESWSSEVPSTLAAPWDERLKVGVALCTLSTSGPDPAIDDLVRIDALRSVPNGGEWESLSIACGPETTAPAWVELRAFLGERVLVVERVEVFEAWAAHLDARSPPLAIGLHECARLCSPGRGHGLESTGGDPLAPREILRELASLARRFLANPELVAVAANGYCRAWRGLSASAPRAADRLLATLALLDRPSAWIDGGGERDHALAQTLTDHAYALLDDLAPACAAAGDRWERFDTIAVNKEGELAFDESDARVLDQVFETHLPAQFARTTGESARDVYRPSQHDVARRIAQDLGSSRLLLVHAPTGTGKTLAYLVPALLWSARNGVRVGIATYTRALQEQASTREVPRALAALHTAGCPIEFRVSVLKGRDNYVCWKALGHAQPNEDGSGETWLAWTALALFALTDEDGDLDRLPLRATLPLESSAGLRRELQSIVAHVRAHSGCCSHRDDRRRCAAEVARRRAEKSHVVITNQAFALARPEYFKHLVFDECEHLHDQAHNAWGHAVSLRQLRNLLGRLHQPHNRRSPALLDRLRRSTIAGSPSHAALEAAHEAWSTSSAALSRLEGSLETFVAWRDARAEERNEREMYAALLEFAALAEALPLLENRRAWIDGATELDALLAGVDERLSGLPLRGIRALRQGVERARLDLQSATIAVQAWLPDVDDPLVERPGMFYDVERDPSGELLLVSRVLLPQELLGRRYYPGLCTAVFVSATAWLQQSFQPTLAYIGLERAAHPAEGEDREPREVGSFRAPEVFDYRRVLVAVPRDAPPVSTSKSAFLDYTRRFIAFLGERTRGRMLVLFTNSQDVSRVGEELSGFFRARRIALWFQNMDGTTKEELGELFRSRIDSVLLGVDTFWYGADFPGETLEYLVIVRLPYGVPDRYHHAQCASVGLVEQRNKIYLPRAIAKFRQGFGRLMRRVTDKGCVFVLDGRILDPRHRFFLRELPLGTPGFPSLDRAGERDEPSGARLVRADTSQCVAAALEHMGLVDSVRARGLDLDFAGAFPRSPFEDLQL
ncbi:MAG: ATP-dependent DNA helicase [Planctomycetota bacterium]